MSDNTTALMSMKLPELKKLAAEAGVAGAATMRKGDIIAALSTQTAPAKQQDTERPARASRGEESTERNDGERGERRERNRDRGQIGRAHV